jgi:hypothetical protein
MAGHVLEHGDGLGAARQAVRPQQVAGHHAGDPVAQLLLVDEDPLPGGQARVQVAVEVAEHAAGVARRRQGKCTLAIDFSS